MPNPYFQFKQFTIHQDRCSMKVTTDSCLFGAWVAEKINNDNSVKNILDIGSGTGLLCLMLAQKSAAAIDAIELQEKDFLQSLENVAESPWKERINMIHADATKYTFNKKHDLIISNPPFYENDLKGGITGKNIAHHDDGLTLENLFNIIGNSLSPAGKFYIILPAKRKADLSELPEHTGLFINQITEVHQTEKHGAFRIMVEGSFENMMSESEEILIKEKGNYTVEFTRLLKDYYLKL